jgi:oligopeptide/dipeptide ABC transporter ATP-binding protein
MYAGQIVEYAGVEDLFDRPSHPYTRGLFNAVPRLGHAAARLEAIPGTVPNPANFPSGCRFHPRCALSAELAAKSGDKVQITIDGHPHFVMRTCTEQEPKLKQVRPNHWAACHFADGYADAPITTPKLDHRREVVAESIVIEEAQA